MLTVYCYSRCSTCQKALKWLDEHNISYTLLDIKTEHQAKFGVQCSIQCGFFRFQEFCVLDSPAHRPPGHIVGERVVVDMLLELIRSDHVVDVQHSIRTRLQAAVPELRAVQDQLVPEAVHKVLIAGAHVILPRTKGHVGSDVDFNEAAPDLDGQPGQDICSKILRGHLSVVQPGRLPGELSTIIPVVLCLGMCAGQ